MTQAQPWAGPEAARSRHPQPRPFAPLRAQLEKHSQMFSPNPQTRSPAASSLSSPRLSFNDRETPLSTWELPHSPGCPRLAVPSTPGIAPAAPGRGAGRPSPARPRPSTLPRTESLPAVDAAAVAGSVWARGGGTPRAGSGGRLRPGKVRLGRPGRLCRRHEALPRGSLSSVQNKLSPLPLTSQEFCTISSSRNSKRRSASAEQQHHGNRSPSTSALSPTPVHSFISVKGGGPLS